MHFWLTLSIFLSVNIQQDNTRIASELTGQLIPENQSFTICPDGASAFRMLRDGYRPNNRINDVDQYFKSLKDNNCQQLSGPSAVIQVMQVKTITYNGGTERTYALVRAENEYGNEVYGIYEPSLSNQTGVDTILESALLHTINGQIGGENGTYLLCPDIDSARRVVRNIPAKELESEENRLKTFEENIDKETCTPSGALANLIDAYDFAGFATGDYLGGYGAFSGRAVNSMGQNISVVMVVSF